MSLFVCGINAREALPYGAIWVGDAFLGDASMTCSDRVELPIGSLATLAKDGICRPFAKRGKKGYMLDPRENQRKGTIDFNIKTIDSILERLLQY